MAISPPSDIVLDVARAVDPAELAAARTQLAERARAGATKVEFPDIAASEASSPATALKNMAGMRFTGHAGSEKTDQTPKAYQKFEAAVLQNFMQSMMPKDSEAVYGKGLAGDMWKSQLAERLADVMADRGGIGIARSMLADHYMDGKRKVPVGPVAGGPERAEIDEQTRLSASLIQEMQRRIVRSLDGEPASTDTANKV